MSMKIIIISQFFLNRILIYEEYSFLGGYIHIISPVGILKNSQTHTFESALHQLCFILIVLTGEKLALTNNDP